jgi:hypothetical protein
MRINVLCVRVNVVFVAAFELESDLALGNRTYTTQLSGCASERR